MLNPVSLTLPCADEHFKCNPLCVTHNLTLRALRQSRLAPPKMLLGLLAVAFAATPDVISAAGVL